jgi:hypothetical protein
VFRFAVAFVRVLLFAWVLVVSMLVVMTFGSLATGGE